MWTCAAGALLFATPALAQQQPPPNAAAEDQDDTRDEEIVNEAAIVVTASARWRELLETPQPVTTFSAEDRNLLSAGTARQIVDLTPGVQLSETFGLNVRGIGRQTPQTLLGQENTVTLYVDGFINLVPFNIAESTLFGGNVQFARGPQGTRYGRNSLAGAINLISRAPTEDLTGEVVAGYGREGAYNAGFNVSGPITDDLGVRVGIQHYYQPSFRDNIGTADGAGFALDNMYYELQFDFDRGPFHFRSRTTHFDYDNQPDYTSPANYNTGPLFGALEPNPQYLYPTPAPDDPNTINIDFAGYDRLDDNLQQIINADWDFGPVTLYYVGGYQQYLATGSADRDGISRRNYPADVLAPGSFAPGTLVPTFYTSNYYNENSFYSHELRLHGDEPDARLQWIIGLYYYNQDFDESYWEAIPDSPELEAPVSGGTPGATTAPNPRRATYQQRNLLQIESRAVFGNINLRLSDHLQFDAGLRYTQDDKNASTSFRYIFSYPPFFAGDFTPLPHSATPSVEDEALTGHAALVWRNPNSEFYVSYARGYEASAFTLGQGLPPNNTARPQYLDDYEVGMTFNFSPTLRLTGSIFNLRAEDMQVPISTRATIGGLPVGPVFATFVNAELAEIVGAEMELSWSPTEGSNITFAYTALSPKFEDFCPPVIGSTPPVCGAVDITNPAVAQTPEDLSGNEIPRAPHNKASLYGYYTFNLGSAGSLIPGGSIAWQGPFYSSAFTKDRFLLPERTVANFTLTYRTLNSAWDVVAYVTNAFESDAPDTVTVSVVGGAIAQNFGRGPDQFYGVTLRRRF
jgi:iron complex outermembrane receptor protein